MKTFRTFEPDRRAFLRRATLSALGGASVFGMPGQLALMKAATAASANFNDYRAIVCLFLLGGNDGFNTLIPSNSYYPTYAGQRGPLAIAQNSLLPLNPASDGKASDGNDYGLHPAMPELAGLFNAGAAAAVANVGTLLYPTTKAAYKAGVNLPPQLFAHNDQQNQWQTSRPDDASAAGWGGRVADLLYSANPAGIPTTLAVAQQFPFLRGNVVDQYVTDEGGLTQLGYEATPGARVSLFNLLHKAGSQSNKIQRAYANVLNHAIDTYGAIAAVLPPTGVYTGFSNSGDGQQMETVARLISASAQALGAQRQIFFVGVGGYDTHNAQISTQASLLANLSRNISALYNATSKMQLSDKVTIFTASDFGRTLSVNSDGTDHGWGNHHFVVGGAVRGRRFFGKFPSLSATAQNPDDAGWGQLIPTTSVEQYVAPIAKWFGISDSSVATIFPNLGRFDLPLGILS